MGESIVHLSFIIGHCSLEDGYSSIVDSPQMT